MNSTWIKKTAQTSILIAQAFLAVACASAKEESFDYSSYEQQASYSVEHFQQQAESCSKSANVSAADASLTFHACKISTSASSVAIRIFASGTSVQKMCVFPTVETNGVKAPITLNPSAPVESRYLKVCGTIAYTGSSATVNHNAFNGLLMVDSLDASRFSQCLSESDFRSCANSAALVFAEGSL